MKALVVCIVLATAVTLLAGITFWYFNHCNSSDRIVSGDRSPEERQRIQISNGRC